MYFEHLNHTLTNKNEKKRVETNEPRSRGGGGILYPGSITVDPTTVKPDISAARATATAKSASAKNDASGSLLSLVKSLSPIAGFGSAAILPSIASVHDANTESTAIHNNFMIITLYLLTGSI